MVNDQSSCGYEKPEEVMEFEWLISRPGAVMEIFQKCQQSWKMEIYSKNYILAKVFARNPHPSTFTTGRLLPDGQN